jgi:hypothetical protein
MRLLLLALLLTAPARAWWCEGHQMVALIAEKHLTPAALAAVTALLQSQPVDPTLQRFCKNPPAGLMTDASTWADDVKKTEQTGTWHYMDIPLGMKHGDLAPYCQPVTPSRNGAPPTGCLLSALRYNLNILHDDKESDSERAKALRYLIHLVGDLHQPLHTTANNDQGGNCVPIQFFADPKIANLHSVWDGMLVNRDTAAKGFTLTQMADDLDQRYRKSGESWMKHGTDFEKWIWEGHKAAQEATYGHLQPKIPIEPYQEHPNCKVESAKDAALHLHVDEAYERKADPLIEEQLAKAGYRLAEVLNEVWP